MEKLNNVYDNGTLMLGQVKRIKKYYDSLYKTGEIDKRTWLNIIEEIDCYGEDNIIVINYDTSFGTPIIKEFDMEMDVVKFEE